MVICSQTGYYGATGLHGWLADQTTEGAGVLLSGIWELKTYQTKSLVMNHRPKRRPTMILTPELVNDLIKNEATERGVPVPKNIDIEALIKSVYETPFPTDITYDADMDYLDAVSSSLFSSIDRLF
jgi:hypothetical protein